MWITWYRALSVCSSLWPSSVSLRSSDSASATDILVTSRPHPSTVSVGNYLFNLLLINLLFLMQAVICQLSPVLLPEHWSDHNTDCLRKNNSTSTWLISVSVTCILHITATSCFKIITHSSSSSFHLTTSLESVSEKLGLIYIICWMWPKHQSPFISNPPADELIMAQKLIFRITASHLSGQLPS